MTVALSGDFGKPRPALVVRSDQFAQTGTVTVLLISAALINAPLLRIQVQPDPANGLRKPSQIMIDKAMSVRREKIGAAFGHVDDDTMIAVTRSLALFFGLG